MASMDSSNRAAPELRKDLEIIPTVFKGRDAFLVRDTLGLIEDPVILERDAAVIVGLLDGERSVEDIQGCLIRRRGGVFIGRDLIEKFLAELDGHYVLDTPRFRRARRKLIADYGRLEVRDAFLAGQSYPSEAIALEAYLHSMLARGKREPPEADPDTICALVAPHIEIETGKGVYARAYRSVQGLSPDTIILLGTGHNVEGGYYSLTDKDFVTPLGRVRTDRDTVAALRDAGGGAVADGDIAHRCEHSLEFQVIFLQHLFGTGFSLVPVLCGSFHRDLSRGRRPMDIPEVSGLLGVLRDMVSKGDSRTLCVAGVDFSHIGPKFGHREAAGALLPDARTCDQALIEAACGGDVMRFWAESKKVRDRTNVCGFSALAALLEIIGPARGVLLDYEFWQDEPARSAVSYAAILFKRQPKHRGGRR